METVNEALRWATGIVLFLGILFYTIARMSERKNQVSLRIPTQKQVKMRSFFIKAWKWLGSPIRWGLVILIVLLIISTAFTIKEKVPEPVLQKYPMSLRLTKRLPNGELWIAPPTERHVINIELRKNPKVRKPLNYRLLDLVVEAKLPDGDVIYLRHNPPQGHIVKFNALKEFRLLIGKDGEYSEVPEGVVWITVDKSKTYSPWDTHYH